MQVKQIKIDVLIIGGGVAGCWLLHSLRQQGLQAILLESDAVGAGQTGQSQGIIHGGVKYALNGIVNRASQSIAAMPKVWDDCLRNCGDIKLSATKILSDAQYLWPSRSISSRFKAFFASHVLRGRCKLIGHEEYPPLFRHRKFKRHLYKLSETVIDSYSLLQALIAPYKNYVLRAEKKKLSIKVSQGKIQGVDYAHDGVVYHVIADDYVFTAGEGAERLINHSLFLNSAMQRRPLRMSLVSFDGLMPIYAHCMGKGSGPMLTITSHQNSCGQWVWYVGGDIAETGAHKSCEQHAKDLYQALQAALPWLTFDRFKSHSFLINRAEGWQSDGKRPATTVVKHEKNLTVIWPTKLTFAPMLPEQLKPYLKKGKRLEAHGLEYLKSWPKAELANPIWDELII